MAEKRKADTRSGASPSAQAIGDDFKMMHHLYGPLKDQVVIMPNAMADTAVAEGWARPADELPPEDAPILSIDESFAITELAIAGVEALRLVEAGGGSPPPVLAPPVISSPLTASGVVGDPFTYTITASNSPTSFGATGLPTGLTVASATGIISGSPTAAATSNVSISATNADGTGSDTLVLTVAAAAGTLGAQNAGRGKGM